MGREELDQLIDLALSGCDSLGRVQREVLTQAGIDLPKLFVPGRWIG